MNKTTGLPVSKLQLFQVGRHFAPRLSAKTGFTLKAREAVMEIYGGALFDFDRSGRSAFEPFRFSHEGAYECCGRDDGCIGARNEWDGIVSSQGVYVPMVFFRHPPCPECHAPIIPRPSCLKPVKQGEENCFCIGFCERCSVNWPCGQWLWAFGKVVPFKNDFDSEDFKSPKTASVSFEGILETPLFEMNWKNWWYGLEGVEHGVAPGLFDRPCQLPDCCSPFRFQYADYAPVACMGDPACVDGWNTPYIYQIQGAATFVIDVKGTHIPRTRIRAKGYGTFSITNAINGTRTFSYGVGEDVFTDTHTGQAIRLTSPNATHLPGLPALPALEVGENTITTDLLLSIGVDPRYST